MSCSAAHRLALIGMGEVGQILAADLHGTAAAHICVWDRLFLAEGSPPLRALQALQFVRKTHSLSEAVAGCSVVISAITAGACAAVAREAANCLAPGTHYFDLNSVSPETRHEAAQSIEAAGGRYVEAAVMSPIEPKRLGSPIWIGGPHARTFLPIAQSLGFSAAVVYSETLGAASAAKMCRSVVIKGMEALLAESLLTARRYAVEQAVLDSLNQLIPVADWRALAWYMVSRSLQHGVRRAEEMREAARTVAAAGIEPWMSDGCVKRQRWAAEHPDALGRDSLEQMLDKVLERHRPIEVEPGERLVAEATQS